LVVGSATNDSAILAVGANDTVLTADSSTATGMKWATPAAGGGMTLLSTTSLGGSSTTISSIAGGYKNLYIVFQDLYMSTSGGDVNIRLNGDTGGNYSSGSFGMDNAVFYGNDNGGGTSVQIVRKGGSTNTLINKVNGAITINRYTSTDQVTGTSYSTGYNNAAFRQNSLTNVFVYDCSAAITSITFFGTYEFSGGTVYIYGVN
jgi:hypothetical protein